MMMKGERREQKRKKAKTKKDLASNRKSLFMIEQFFLGFVKNRKKGKKKKK